MSSRSSSSPLAPGSTTTVKLRISAALPALLPALSALASPIKVADTTGSANSMLFDADEASPSVCWTLCSTVLVCFSRSRLILRQEPRLPSLAESSSCCEARILELSPPTADASDMTIPGPPTQSSSSRFRSASLFRRLSGVSARRAGGVADVIAVSSS